MSDPLGTAIALLLTLPIPAVVIVAIRRLWRSRLSQLPGGNEGDQAGVREPRRPRPFVGSGAVALALPDEDVFDDVG